jgi:hypothetical protein
MQTYGLIDRVLEKLPVKAPAPAQG